MHSFGEILSNNILWATIFSCVLAQLLKIPFHYIFNKELDWTRCIGSGGMPSSHSSSVCTLSTCVGLQHGFDTPLFAVTVAFAVIVMYDAAGVRKAAGEQAKILNRIIKKFEKQEFHIDQELKELIGHTKPEVIAGALLGIVIGICFTILK
ncbi:MAG: divergent PAP2 family protein [Clostridia bacterium]|nr:divergent PAP2 family protein [Clostridia bacterium]